MVNILAFAMKWMIMLAVFFMICVVLSKFIGVLIYNVRNKKWKSLAVYLLAFFIAVAGLKILFSLLSASRISLPGGSGKEYVMDINEVKTNSNGTKVRMTKAMLDLNSISFNVGIKGRDKLVAVEIKKDPGDNKSLREMTGIWAGNRFGYEYYSLGASYEDNSFIDPVYVVCYLSNGEEVYFKVKDEKNAKAKTEIINISKDLNFDGKLVRLRTFTRGVSYSDLYVVSDINIFNLKVEVMEGGKAVESHGASGGGGRNNYGFAPVGDKNITIKFTEKSTGKEQVVQLK